MKQCSQSLQTVLWIASFWVPVSSAQAQAPGTQVRKVSNIESSYPFWSPDGARLVFQSDRNGDSDIRLDTSASISPDGTRIAFRRVIDEPAFDGALQLGNRNSEVYVMNRDGQQPTNLTRSAAFDGWPSWSPTEA